MAKATALLWAPKSEHTKIADKRHLKSENNLSLSGIASSLTQRNALHKTRYNYSGKLTSKQVYQRTFKLRTRGTSGNKISNQTFSNGLLKENTRRGASYLPPIKSKRTITTATKGSSRTPMGNYNRPVATSKRKGPEPLDIMMKGVKLKRR